MMVLCETRSVSGNDLSGEGHKWGAKPTKLKEGFMSIKQNVESIEKSLARMIECDRILEDVYNQLQEFQYELSGKQREVIEKIMDMLEIV